LSAIYNLLEFTNFETKTSLDLNAKFLEEFKYLGIDKVHYSGKFPTIFFKEIKSFNSESLKEIAQIHHKLWNYKKVLFLYVTTLTEIRIYNCTNNPFNYEKKSLDISKELQKLEIAKNKIDDDKEKLNNLIEIFSASAIDSGSIWSRKNDYIKKIKLDKRIDKFLVKSLKATAEQLEKDGLNQEITNSLIMRSLFIMYLEDKGATPTEFYTYKGKQFDSYLDLLEDKEATYNFFQRIKDNFNGNVFPVSSEEKKNVTLNHLQYIKRCFTNGDIKNESLFEDWKDWRVFKFDIIQIELLSEIYESFLSDRYKERSGSYYTPSSLVELILNEVLPVKNETKYKLKILDPTCGSGIFLVEAYKRIVQRYINAHPNKPLTFTILRDLMTDSIYGIELNPKSIKVATFSLYLSLLDFLEPKKLWFQNGEKFPYLINDLEYVDPNEQGINLFRTDAIDIEDNTDFITEYDLIVGNPPYGKTKVPENIKKYCETRGYAKEFVIPFIHKSSSLAVNGKIVLVVPTKLLTNTSGTSEKFREWLFNENYVEKVYNLSILRKAPKTFGGSLFSSAVAPASILFFQNEIPEKVSRTIEYWAPKTFIKNNIAEGILIDSSDVKFLPREECQKPNTKIWKIAQWGGLNDFNLLSNFLQDKSFLNYLEDNNVEKQTGFQLMTEPDEKLPEPNKVLSEFGYLSAKNINRFYTCKEEKSNINMSITSKEAKLFYTTHYNANLDELPPIDLFHRNGNINTFKPPHVLIKEGFSDNLFCSTFLDYECAFTKTVLGLKSDDIDILKLITCYLNSSFSTYFLFLTSSSWGVERERVKPNELYLLPYINENINNKKIVQVYDGIKSKIDENYPLKVNVENYEIEINKLISESFNISINEQIFIEDTINYSLDLFLKGSKSVALKPIDTNTPETLSYAKKLCEELNETLVDSDLKLVAKVYKSSNYTPLTLVIFQFISKDETTLDVELLESDIEFNNKLSWLNKFTLDKYSKSIYVQKQITHYDDNQIFMIKPNQKRFWTLSQAIEDAQNITFEIMSMSQ